MRWGDQTPIYSRGELSWGIGDDPDRTFSVHGEVFTNYFHVEKYRNPCEVQRVAEEHWQELQDIALTALTEGNVTRRRPRHLREDQAWYHMKAQSLARSFDDRTVRHCREPSPNSGHPTRTAALMRPKVYSSSRAVRAGEPQGR